MMEYQYKEEKKHRNFVSADNFEGAEESWRSELDGECWMELVETIPNAQLDKKNFNIKHKTIYQVRIVNIGNIINPKF